LKDLKSSNHFLGFDDFVRRVLLRQENFLSVLPRVCRTLLTQMAMAALSRAFFGSFIVLLTLLIHLQNLEESGAILTRARKKLIATLSEGKMDINRLTHTRDDSCGIASYYSQSVSPGKYNLTNLVPDARRVNPLSVQNLIVYPREGFGANNAEIDAESVLKNQPEFKNNRCLIRAQARPFLSVPFMGTGRGNSDVESMLLHAEQVRQGKECGTIAEQGFDGVFEPLIKTVRENIQAPKHLVEEVAANGWIRGGIPSRSYVRDVNC